MQAKAFRFGRGLVAALSAAALALTGCGDFFDQLRAEEVALAALLHTPEMDNPAGGDPVPGSTVFTLFFGRVDRSRILPGTGGSESAEDGAFTGIADAEVTLKFTDSGGTERQLEVKSNGAGRYGLSSEEADLLEYTTEPVTVTIEYAGKTHRLRVTPPEPAAAAEFADQPVIADHAAGEDLTLTRAEALGSENPLAFVHLQGVAGEGEGSSWTNFPSDGMGFLRLVLDDAQWRTDSFTIPGDQFAAGSGYLATLSAAARGEIVTEDGSDPLFTSSSFLAAAGSGGGVLVP